MAEIKYFLNEEGRRKSLLAGGSGTREQVLVGMPDEETIGLFTVGDDGKAHVELKGGYWLRVYQLSSGSKKAPPQKPYMSGRDLYITVDIQRALKTKGWRFTETSRRQEYLRELDYSSPLSWPDAIKELVDRPTALGTARADLENDIQELDERLWAEARREKEAEEYREKSIAEEEKARSEERRVGKECRSRWSPYH